MIVFMIYDQLIWCSKVAYVGTFPSVNWRAEPIQSRCRVKAGQKISGGPYCLMQLRGDWKWHHEAADWRRGAILARMCSKNHVVHNKTI